MAISSICKLRMPCVLIGVAQIIILYLFIIFLYHGNIENHDHLEVLRKNVDISTINLREEIVKIEVATPTVRNDHVDLTVTDNTHLVVKKNTIQLKDDSQSSSPSLSNVPFSLPGASKGMHSILSLSDEEFDKISISAMMAQYGEAEGGGTCPIDFGNQLVNRWRGEKKSNCDSHESLSQTDQSSIDCYLVRQTRHHGNGDNICRMYNVSIDLSIFANRQATRGVIQQYVATTHSKQPYMSLPRGTVQGTCHPNANFKQKSMPGWNEDWTVNSFEEVKSLSCDHWVDHKILIIQRDTFANFFHDSEDFTNAFLAFAILQWSRSSSQIFLTDLYPEGPFWPIWAQAFSSKMSQKLPPEDVRSRDLQGVQAGGKVLTSWDISQNLLFNSPGKRTCFRDIAVGIYGPASPITVASWDTPCFKTALVRAYSDFVIRGLQLQTRTHYALPTPSKTITIIYMARRASTEWPEKRFCNSTHSFFECRFWDRFGIRSLGRMVRNEKDVISALKGLEKELNAGGGSVPKIVFRDVDYNLLTLEQQISTDLSTDIMIGPHGAGLMHNIFMRDRAVLIELFVDGSSANRHFHNLAHWFGRKYVGEVFGNPIEVSRLVSIVRRQISNIDLNSY